MDSIPLVFTNSNWKLLSPEIPVNVIKRAICWNTDIVHSIYANLTKVLRVVQHKDCLMIKIIHIFHKYQIKHKTKRQKSQHFVQAGYVCLYHKRHRHCFITRNVKVIQRAPRITREIWLWFKIQKNEIWTNNLFEIPAWKWTLRRVLARKWHNMKFALFYNESNWYFSRVHQRKKS